MCRIIGTILTATALVAVLVCSAGVSHGDTCRRAVSVSNHSYSSGFRQSHATYYTPNVYYPAFTVGGYSAADVEKELLKLKAEFNQYKYEQLLRDYQRLQQGGQVLPLEQAPKHVLVMQNKCASCHDDSKAKASGGGFVLFEQGKLRDLSGEEKFKVMRELSLGNMPKNGKLSDEEFSAIVKGL